MSLVVPVLFLGVAPCVGALLVCVWGCGMCVFCGVDSVSRWLTNDDVFVVLWLLGWMLAQRW